MTVRLDSPVYNGAVLLDSPTAYPDTGMQVLNGPFEAYSGETITIRTNKEPDPAATYAGLSVTLTDIAPDGDEYVSTLTVPDREAEGLGIGYVHFIVVTAAADSDDEASTQNTLAPEPDIHVWHTIDGYDALEDKSDSIWYDGDDAESFLAQDGDLGIAWNPNALTGLTVDAAGIASADEFGQIERQLFDHESTQGVDGEYTEVGTVSVTEDGGQPTGVIRFSAADGTELRYDNGNLVNETAVPIQVSDQRDPRGAAALTGAPDTMDVVDGEATLDLSALDPQPAADGWLFVTVYDEGTSVPDDVARRYPLQFSEDVEA